MEKIAFKFFKFQKCVCSYTSACLGRNGTKTIYVNGFSGDFFFFFDIMEIVVLFLTFQVTACTGSINRTN